MSQPADALQKLLPLTDEKSWSQTVTTDFCCLMIIYVFIMIITEKKLLQSIPNENQWTINEIKAKE